MPSKQPALRVPPATQSVAGGAGGVGVGEVEELFAGENLAVGRVVVVVAGPPRHQELATAGVLDDRTVAVGEVGATGRDPVDHAELAVLTGGQLDVDDRLLGVLAELLGARDPVEEEAELERPPADAEVDRCQYGEGDARRRRLAGR